MNETPLHEPLIAEEGKEKERVFTGTPERIVNICLASISALIIYWTVYVSADVMWKHGLYIMTVFCMTLVIYPFEKSRRSTTSPLWTGCSSSAASPVRPTPSGNIWIASCGWAC